MSWVPPGAWLAPEYAEWQAPAALRGPVACLWARVIPDGAGHPGLVLPASAPKASVKGCSASGGAVQRRVPPQVSGGSAIMAVPISRKPRRV
jgi:hypothetical protein